MALSATGPYASVARVTPRDNIPAAAIPYKPSLPPLATLKQAMAVAAMMIVAEDGDLPMPSLDDDVAAAEPAWVMDLVGPYA